MGLCGAHQCRCTVASLPATTGSYAGTLPTVSVSGASPYSLGLDAAYALAVSGSFPTPAASWSTWAPIIGQGATSNISKSLSFARYTATGYQGKTIFFTMRADIGGAGTAGSPVTVSIPATLSANAVLRNQGVGCGIVQDASAPNQRYVSTLVAQTTTAVAFRSDAASAAGWGANPNIALAAGDIIFIWGWVQSQ